jgi:hypothetical protein
VALKHGQEILPTELFVDKLGEMFKFVVDAECTNSSFVVCFDMNLEGRAFRLAGKVLKVTLSPR